MHIILRTIDAVLYKERNEYHWLVCALQSPGTKWEGSVLQNLHKEANALERAKEKLVDLFELQYANTLHDR